MVFDAVYIDNVKQIPTMLIIKTDGYKQTLCPVNSNMGMLKLKGTHYAFHNFFL